MFKYEIDQEVYFLHGFDVQSWPITWRKEYKASNWETSYQYYVELIEIKDDKKEVIDVLLEDQYIHLNEEDAKLKDEDKEEMIEQIEKVIEWYKAQIKTMNDKILEIKWK